MKKPVKIALIAIACLIVAVGIYALTVDLVVKNSVKDRMITPDEAVRLKDIDCIIVLGCKVRADGSPSDMLRDRVAVGSDLWLSGTSETILMSGDHRTDDYNEIAVMCRLAEEAGVPTEHIETDGMGLSTYESLWRLKNVYGYESCIIVTQEFHLYRSLYIAEKLGIDAYGVPADLHRYGVMILNNLREILARNKDFIYCIRMPVPTSTEKAD